MTPDIMLSLADLAALRAVERGTVKRLYDAKGNRFQRTNTPPAAATLWKLLRLGLIEDGPGDTGIFRNTVTMRLTETGRQAALHRSV